MFYLQSNSRKKLPTNKKNTKIVVVKSEKKLVVYANDELLKTYKISLGSSPKGKKHFEGDGKTPEGFYTINDKNPKSICYLNLGVSYPNTEDIQYAKENGKSAGGDVKIHGVIPKLSWIGKLHRFIDWSRGCICVTNTEIKELYDNVPIGTSIEIKP